jgi:trans-aconitate 2-methyltransferase
LAISFKTVWQASAVKVRRRAVLVPAGCGRYVTKVTWDPNQYLKFAGERLRPAVDLLARIPVAAPRTVIDLGCGTGILAPLLMQRWPDAKLTGVDSSSEMLAQARADNPGAHFVQAEVATWRPEQAVDVIYSNAMLHWLDGHESLIAGLLAALAPAGWLAIQMPRNFDEPSHTTINDAIEQGPWRAKLEPHLRRRPVAEPEHYWRWLHDKVAALQIWETQYLQVLQGPDAVAEYVKGSWLKPFLDRLDEPERGGFEADYRRRVGVHYPAEKNGATLYPIRRLFIVAQKQD